MRNPTYCTSIVAFECEYYFDSSGIVTLYEPGGLHKTISKRPLIVSNFTKTQADWDDWLRIQKSGEFAPDRFNFEHNNWNHFVLEAALFFGLDLMMYPDFVVIMEEPIKIKKKIIAGGVKSAGVASQMAANMPILAAQNPVSSNLLDKSSIILQNFIFRDT